MIFHLAFVCGKLVTKLKMDEKCRKYVTKYDDPIFQRGAAALGLSDQFDREYVLSCVVLKWFEL